MPGVTQTAIAKRLKISRSSVAAVLSNSPQSRIAPATRDLILKTATEMGYVPNRHAQIMSKGKSEAIGIITFGHSSGITQQKVQISVDAIYNAGYEPVEQNVYWYTDSGDKVCRRMIELRVEGVVLIHPSPFFTQKHLDILLKAGIPVVALGSSILEGITRYMSDKEQGFQTLTDYLLSLGHRRLTLLLGEDSHEKKALGKHSSWHREKAIQGFQKALAAAPEAEGRIIVADIEIERPSLPDGFDAYKPAYKAMKTLLSSEDELPDAVLCSNDTWAHGALRACSEHDLRIPHDLALVGFENELLSPYGLVPLTTMAHPACQMAMDGIQILIAQIRKERPLEDRLIILPCELVIRRSCGAYLKKKTSVPLHSPLSSMASEVG